MVVDLNSGFESRFVTAIDGLKLHARLYGTAQPGRLPVLCLPGLTRNARDFHSLAMALATDETHPRQVIAVDYRGRGQSDYDKNPDNYTVQTELADVLSLTTALNIGKAIFVGTSRGGLISMVMSAVRPTLMAGAVLNDIGPALEVEGLLRIKSYVGKISPPASWDEAIALTKQVGGGQFPALSEADWQQFVRQLFRDDNGRPVLDYDPALARGLAGWTPDEPIPTLWPQFDGLKDMPLMLIRGTLTDLLSEATVREMQARHPAMALLSVEGQGHAPLINDAPTIDAVRRFINAIDPA